MVSVLVSSAIDHGLIPGQVRSKPMKLVLLASSLNMLPQGERAKTGWIAIRIMSASGATCLSTDCCFSELAL